DRGRDRVGEGADRTPSLPGRRAPGDEAVRPVPHHEQIAIAPLGGARGARDAGPRKDPACHQPCRSCEELAPIRVAHPPPPWCSPLTVPPPPPHPTLSPEGRGCGEG